ncbi:hypothetical protein [Pseudarthrobacter sp. N5]|uniref:hypothetical protein n=1 Tax=Pseudarthrobacter sp. N5 TaxID=3418416 RepID=UPI003CEED4BC
MRRTIRGILAALALSAGIMLTATACTITTVDPGYVPPPPLPALEQLKQAPLEDAATFSGGEGVLNFVTEDRNMVCALTSARGEDLNLPYEHNGFADSANNKLDTVPVAHCELAAYPKAEPADVKDDCAGTGLGYLGGTALLTPDKASYGGCRSGLTQMESEFGPKGSKDGAISKMPVLSDGQNVERNGLRCSAYNGGVSCGNLSAGVAFFISKDRYELISGGGIKATAPPSEASKTP